MGQKIIPDHLVERWTNEGLTDAQIVERLERELHITVTRQAITAWRKRSGLPPKREDRPRAMPWDLRPEHRYMEPARIIRLWVKRERGAELSPEDQSRLDRGLKALGEDLVFMYAPDSEHVWYRVPRRPEDTGIWRA